jgi:hypothetical protein
MPRRLSATWLSLLAALLAVPLLSACPGRNQVAEHPFHIKPLPDYSPYQGRPERAFKTTAPADRQAGTSGRPFLGFQAPKFFAPRHSAGKQPGHSSFIAGSARHFTLFPTGPPHHH